MKLSRDQAAMLDRLKAAAGHRLRSGSAGYVHVAAPCRQQALRECAELGLARVWAGEGRDAGLLIGEITRAGSEAEAS